MGSWTVLKRWLPHSYNTHESNNLCTEEAVRGGADRCYPIVAEHQEFPTGAPEFTISIAWQEGDLAKFLNGNPTGKKGWRYKIHHTGTDGRESWVSAYGIASKEEARSLAEDRATRIAKAQQPEEVYKFTPEV